MNLKEAIAVESTKPCHCVRCSLCRGSGSVWFDLDGNYLGQVHCDDMDEMETCDECGGSGIVEECERCEMLSQMHEDLEYEEAQRNRPT
jgi:DnaJ-class molecular chaperone